MGYTMKPALTGKEVPTKYKPQPYKITGIPFKDRPVGRCR